MVVVLICIIMLINNIAGIGHMIISRRHRCNHHYHPTQSLEGGAGGGCWCLPVVVVIGRDSTNKNDNAINHIRKATKIDHYHHHRKHLHHLQGSLVVCCGGRNGKHFCLHDCYHI